MWKRDCKIFRNLHLQLYWPVSPSVVTIASPPSLIKRSLVSLFVSNWPIGGSQSSRTTSDKLIHIFYCAENITYIVEKYYIHYGKILQHLSDISLRFYCFKIGVNNELADSQDRDWVLRPDYALQHLPVVTSMMMIAHQWNYGDIHQSPLLGQA